MKTLNTRRTNRRSFITILVLLSCLVGAFCLVWGVAHSQQAGFAAERKFENTVPEHVPIKVKLRNEQSFKKKENKNWARELEN